MPVETDADREAFVNASEFAVAVAYTVTATGEVYTFASDGITPLAGIFDNAFTDLFHTNDGPGISTTAPILHIRDIDIPNGGVGGENCDTLVVQGKSYYVRDFNPDGTGFTVLKLEAVT